MTGQVPRSRIPVGLLLGPFVAGMAATLLVAVGTRHDISAGWVFAGAIIGVMAAAFSLAASVRHHHPAAIAYTEGQRAARSAPVHGEASRPDTVQGLRTPEAAIDDAGLAGDMSTERAVLVEPTAEADGDVVTATVVLGSDRGRHDPLAHIHAVEHQGRRLSKTCVNCGTSIGQKDDACTNCGQKQVYQCKGCQTQIRLDWTNCPECGRSVS